MEFTKPNSLNGAQLKSELSAQGITIEVIDDNGTGTISFDVAKAKEGLAASIVAAHVGVETQPTIADKLASVGLSIDDLKAALA
jgi:hypothetical protein